MASGTIRTHESVELLPVTPISDSHVSGVTIDVYKIGLIVLVRFTIETIQTSTGYAAVATISGGRPRLGGTWNCGSNVSANNGVLKMRVTASGTKDGQVEIANNYNDTYVGTLVYLSDFL